MKKKTIAFLAIAVSLSLFSCKKDPAMVQEITNVESKTTFNYQKSIPPEILKLMEKDMLKDGLFKQAASLSNEYDFESGEKIAALSRDYPTTTVSGVGTVLAGVTFTENSGSSTTSYPWSGGTNSIAFNSMNTGSALNAYNNSTPPSGTYLSSSVSINGFQLPTLQANVTDINGFPFSTPFFILRYTSIVNGTSYTSSPNLEGINYNCGSTSCNLRQIKIKFNSSPLYLYLNDGVGLSLPTQVRVYIYYRTSCSGLPVFPATWNNWVSEDVASGGTGLLYSIQARIYLIKI